mmetsp:Transcript_4560/g.12764  ORF Transcript_4560/g.12764 Transcript_4560/m.12764 type:complete len:188 (-) Transcript_4560:167-730(-)|eukprot:CAMPEP_0119122330 /NCGR_PEP_ID=MMETSP1310-20130426/2613_1 /TAXON_ID=464262 /ORGANISM="Genus nov. species nov., Strain RCC2339" /LENGTH=187 /DNA_ID=CAMNT_0007111971 /DNA_START=168 /DNA_END=731 /DNA_ORIENTATION=-
MDRRAKQEQIVKERTALRERAMRHMKKLKESESLAKMEYPPMSLWQRLVIMEVADDFGLVAHEFGIEEVNRHVRVFKKEEEPSYEDLSRLQALAKGQEPLPIPSAGTGEQNRDGDEKETESGRTGVLEKRVLDATEKPPIKPRPHRIPPAVQAKFMEEPKSLNIVKRNRPSIEEAQAALKRRKLMKE